MQKKINAGMNKAYKFKENQVAYSKSKKSYVQIKSFDEAAKIYNCKIVKRDGQPNEDCKLAEDDISKFINIKVNMSGAGKFEGQGSVDESM